ncbi:glycosyltransferase [Vitiosangium sp. GDMCC 1.1324]|uniref:glycosyltransferase n=1 Tax=Vitiosangium sp. (strain GDMCC 1.1324) TaxID=2138576 RepID=UPI000D35DEC1|nr:glycosyltransferase [Vitiosangium sp. GDMCC 1.1324]PTL82446.1 glycosyl transferase [Vitiosangium sp. GDMCC 1.1324]
MTHALSLTLLTAALLGVAALGLQFFFVLRYLRSASRARTSQARPSPGRPPAGISILKPLCGVDDDLEANLAWFATLDYPAYEVILGVKDTRDPAYAVARAAVARWPHIMRLELQHGEPGLNPKVNQLITLAGAARYDLLLISDSNTRAGAGYLEEIARTFEDPTVGCISHPVSGIGERTLGSLMDNLYQGATAGSGQIAAKQAVNQDIVVGKSMALRREDVESLGGFYSVRNVLAEDYVIGRWVTRRLGKRAVVARSPVYNVSQKKSVQAFFKRYARWSIIHHTCVPTPVYLAQSLLNPLPWALLGALLSPSALALGVVGGVALAKLVHDVTLFHLMRPGQSTPWMTAPAVLLKDLLLFAAWANGLFARTVDWRGNKLRVMPGSKLVPPTPELTGRLSTTEPERTGELIAG